MKFIIPLIIISLLACKSKNDKFDYTSTVASNVFEAQLKYLDQTLFNYSRISDTGVYYYKQSSILEQRTEAFKKKIKNGQTITPAELNEFLTYFQNIISPNKLVDTEIFENLKKQSLTTVSDADLLQLYIKNYFVGILLNNKLLPFDTWGTIASAPRWTISQGDIFKVELATKASNSKQANEWFLVKDNLENSLTKENIIDTLQPDSFGTVMFETTQYKKGENRLMFISRLNTPEKDRMVAKEILFYVK